MSGEAFDAVVVGAGPAGSAAALSLARAGRSVCLLERGPFPGSKNLFGGVIYPRVLDVISPGWVEEAPIERRVTRRATMLLTDTQCLSVDFRSASWGAAGGESCNGVTALRPRFDSWLASRAEAEGAVLLTSTTATGLLRTAGGGVRGVRTDRPDGEIEAKVVVACDGVNSFLAREAGCAKPPSSHDYTLGVKEVLGFPAEEIERRFALSPGEGADFEVLGGTGGVAGGGFVYTNSDTVSVGLVLELASLERSGRRPEQLLAAFKQNPGIAPYVSGGELLEYGAHLIPEAGIEMLPQLAADGFLVAGDAAGMCLAAGIWLEGVNFALASGAAAGEAATAAVVAGDVTQSGLRERYRGLLEQGFVLADLRRLRRAPELLFSPRVQGAYPSLACNMAERLFTVTNPEPKPGLRRIARSELKRSGLRFRDVVRDVLSMVRTFG